MSVLLNFGTDVGGRNAYAPYLATDQYSASLLTGTSSSVTVPSNFAKWIAVMSYQPGSDIWVRVNGTAAQPAGATFAANNSALLPSAISVNAGDTISCYNNSTTSQDVGIQLYAIS